MKRQQKSLENKHNGLKPYIPKRQRCQENDGSSSKPGKSSVTSSEISEPGSKIFTLNPTIVCQIGDEVSCKLPKQQNKTDYHGHHNAVTSLEWSVPSYSHLLLTSSLDGEVKIWDCFTRKQCVRTLKCHQAGVKSAVWSVDGQNILSGGFDKVVNLTDLQYNKTFQEFEMSSFVTCLKLCPSDPQLFLASTDDSGIHCWDTRIGEVIHRYKGKFGQILSLEFIPGRDEFVASSDLVCRNSDDRNILVFDLRSTAVISNQIYHEKYTCPSLRAHPNGTVFVAQSNGNYAAMFSTKPPFKLNKFKRFEGHQVEGYPIGCDISPDGAIFASGSSDGKLYFYNFISSEIKRTFPAHESACVNIQFHPVLGNTLATSSWDGNVSVWH